MGWRVGVGMGWAREHMGDERAWGLGGETRDGKAWYQDIVLKRCCNGGAGEMALQGFFFLSKRTGICSQHPHGELPTICN